MYAYYEDKHDSRIAQPEKENDRMKSKVLGIPCHLRIRSTAGHSVPVDGTAGDDGRVRRVI